MQERQKSWHKKVVDFALGETGQTSSEDQEVIAKRYRDQFHVSGSSDISNKRYEQGLRNIAGDLGSMSQEEIDKISMLAVGYGEQGDSHDQIITKVRGDLESEGKNVPSIPATASVITVTNAEWNTNY